MHPTTSARPLPRPLPFRASRSTSALCPSLRAEAEVRPLPATSAHPFDTHPMKGTPMTEPQEDQRIADELTRKGDSDDQVLRQLLDALPIYATRIGYRTNST